MRVNFDFVSTAKRLPDEDGNYLTINDIGRLNMYSYCCDYGEFNTSKYSHDYPIKEVKFWAKIPEDLVELSRALEYAYLYSIKEKNNE